MHHTLRLLLCPLATLLSASSLLADQPAVKLPRYALQPGQQLNYVISETTTGQVAIRSDSAAEVLVVRQNPDGGWRVIVRQTSSSELGDGTQKHRTERADVLAFDLQPDGRAANETRSLASDPASFFPRLPATADELAGAWEQKNLFGEPIRLTMQSPDPLALTPYLRIRAQSVGQTEKVYESSRTTVYDFDPRKGLVVGWRNESSQGYGFQIKSTGKGELKSVETLEADELVKLQADADIFFAATDAYGKAYLASQTSGDAAGALRDAKTLLESARDKLTLPLLRDAMDRQIAQHDQLAQYTAESARERAAVLNKPGAPFETVDLDGKPHSLAGYRGKVVVMDFWYRGCGWCVRAMPQIKQIADDFRGQSVVVLGMNTDQNEADARFVHQTMELNYPTLKAQGLPKKYSVRGFPTLLILDQTGVVRAVHVGWSADLRDKVGADIRKLLSESEAGG